MADRSELAKQFIDAQRKRDAGVIDAAAQSLADDAVLASPSAATWRAGTQSSTGSRTRLRVWVAA